MGVKDSKPSFITYDEAVKRVSDSELRRIREAFKRCASGSTLSLETFEHDVLCDAVPSEVAEWLYQACGGTKRGISLKDLLCGIIVLTKGSKDEKIKFLWTLYINNQGDNSMYINKWDFARTLHWENSSLPPNYTLKNSDVLTSLFGNNDKVSFDQFRSWLLIHNDATVLSKWLLVDQTYNLQHDIDTPTFYQSLAGVTHLEEKDIIDLEKYFWSLRNTATTGQLDLESLTPLLAPPLPPGAARGMFLALDENQDGHVDFKEICCGVSAACRGPTTERLKFCFKIFDIDRDGLLNMGEIAAMAAILAEVAAESQSRASTPDGDGPTQEKTYETEEIIQSLKERLTTTPKKLIFQLGPISDEDKEKKPPGSNGVSKELVLTQEDFLIWSIESASSLMEPFLDIIFEVCHVVLGLRPQCKHQERDIVLGSLRGWCARGYAVGQLWYVTSTSWWSAWCAHTAAPAACCGEEDGGEEEGSCSSSSEPGPIDSSSLCATGGAGVDTSARRLTGEGGPLRPGLRPHVDLRVLPAALWRALATWYGAPRGLPRQVIRTPEGELELELYPLELKIYRHASSPQRVIHSSLLGTASAPQKQLAYTAAFSRLATVKQVTSFISAALTLPRDNVRLWTLEPRVDLLEDETCTLVHLTTTSLLLEVRGADLTWAEELAAPPARRNTLAAVAGATGLHNLGNTCYMNAALQAVWNTPPLCEYFTRGLHLQDLNVNNPLGTRGVLALRFGELCNEVWAGCARAVSPLRVRAALSRVTPDLTPGLQHDAQETLAGLLDALHEDTNRHHPPIPYTPAPTTGPALHKDQTAADECWQWWCARNSSVVSSLFYGQLKSRVRCLTCDRRSVRFDVYNMLSVPLPLDVTLVYHVKVIRIDGSVPIRYGVKINSEGTYWNIKEELSKMCGIPADLLILCPQSAPLPAPAAVDGARARPRGPLVAFELGPDARRGSDCEDAPPPQPCAETETETEESLPAAQRSRSEIAMSKSPPGFYSLNKEDYRSKTLPKNVRKSIFENSSPTLSVKSLNFRPSSPKFPRIKFGSSPSSMNQMDEVNNATSSNVNYIFAVHRKVSQSSHGLSVTGGAAWSTWGSPRAIGLSVGLSGRELHARVWSTLSRALSPSPRGRGGNHAADCDDSLRYSFPFRLRLTDAEGARCGVCPWVRVCRGCVVPQEGEGALVTERDDVMEDGVIHQFSLRWLRQHSGRVLLAVDWEPTALHLRYRANRDKECEDHSSVAEVAAAAARGVALSDCLRAFTREETLGESYRCGACKTMQPATVTLQLWRLPPVLIIHLKRFQYVNNKWVKSHKIVDFPYDDFDPTSYLASIPQETILRHHELKTQNNHEDDRITESDDDDEAKPALDLPKEHVKNIKETKRKETKRKRLESTSLVTTPVLDDDLIDFHKHHLEDGEDPFDLKYRLYAVVCHSGQLSGGHYVTYTRSEPDVGAGWLCYNDSMCRPARAPPAAAAYLLFYVRRGLRPSGYLPPPGPGEPPVRTGDGRGCRLQ